MAITKKFLVKFENSIADLFNKSTIKAPVHLSHGNERQLIEIFKKKIFQVMTGFFVLGGLIIIVF